MRDWITGHALKQNTTLQLGSNTANQMQLQKLGYFYQELCKASRSGGHQWL